MFDDIRIRVDIPHADIGELGLLQLDNFKAADQLTAMTGQAIVAIEPENSPDGGEQPQ